VNGDGGLSEQDAKVLHAQPLLFDPNQRLDVASLRGWICSVLYSSFHALGEDTDPDSGAELHHITKAIASLSVLRAAMINGTWIDDRPPPAPAGFLQSLNDKMVMLAAKFPDPVARYLANGKRGPGRAIDEA